MVDSAKHKAVVLRFADYHFDRNWQMPAHSHEGFHELLLITGGRIQTAVQETFLEGRPGSVIVYPDSVIHQETAMDDKPVQMFCLAWKDGPVPNNLLLSFDQRGRMLMLMRWILEIYPARSPQEQDMLDALIQAALYEHSHSAVSPQDNIVLTIKRFVLAHLTEPLHLEDLAAVACMSKYHFAHVFRQASGQAPMEYVRELRVETARSLLLTSRLPLRAIAAQAGFRDEFHLSRVFHQVTGNSPGSLR